MEASFSQVSKLKPKIEYIYQLKDVSTVHSRRKVKSQSGTRQKVEDYAVHQKIACTYIPENGQFIIPNPHDAAFLYTADIYGAGSKSKGKPVGLTNNTEILILMDVEAAYLFHARILDIIVENERLSESDVWKLLVANNDEFTVLFATYMHFRRLGYIVRSGLKFGGHFMIYNDSPDECHANYLVLSHSGATKQKWNQITATRRVSETVAKELIIQFVSYPEEPSSFEGMRSASLSDILLKRWIPQRDREDTRKTKNSKNSATDESNDSAQKVTFHNSGFKLAEVKISDSKEVLAKETPPELPIIEACRNKVMCSETTKQNLNKVAIAACTATDESSNEPEELCSLSQVELPEIKQIKNLISQHILLNPPSEESASDGEDGCDNVNYNNSKPSETATEQSTNSNIESEYPNSVQASAGDDDTLVDIKNTSTGTVVMSNACVNEADSNSPKHTDYVDVETVEDGDRSTAEALLSYTRMMEDSDIDVEATDTSNEVDTPDNRGEGVSGIAKHNVELGPAYCASDSLIVNVDDIETAGVVSLSNYSECSDLDVDNISLAESSSYLHDTSGIQNDSERISEECLSSRKRKGINLESDEQSVKRFRHSTPRPTGRPPIRLFPINPSQSTPPQKTEPQVNHSDNIESEQSSCSVQ